MLLRPTVVLDSVLEIKPEMLNKYGVKGLILDLDNTLTTHNNPHPSKGVLNWIQNMKNAGISLMIVSNNMHKRVKPFADMLMLDFESNGRKPFPVGFNRAAERMRLEKNQIAVVGDQLYTDILGANLGKFKSIFVFPIEPEKNFLFKIKRILEKPFIPKRGKI